MGGPGVVAANGEMPASASFPRPTLGHAVSWRMEFEGAESNNIALSF